MLPNTKALPIFQHRLRMNCAVDSRRRYPNRFMPLIMKNIGTAKIAMLCSTTAHTHAPVGFGVYTDSVVCKVTTAIHERMFST